MSTLPDRFARDGYICPLRALTGPQAQDGLAMVERLEAKGSGRLPTLLRTKPHLLLPWFWDLTRSEAILTPLRAILGPDILCYGSSFIDKRPNDPGHVAWHQDVTYWGLDEHRAVTAWIALTPSTPEAGCVRVVPRSHKTLLPHTDSNDPTNMLGRGERLVQDIDAAAGVDLVLQPGEFSLHDGLIIHGSYPNRSAHRRLGYVARYIPADLRISAHNQGSATLVCGRDHGRLPLEQAPEAEMSPEAVKRHGDIFRGGMRTIFKGKLKEPKP